MSHVSVVTLYNFGLDKYGRISHKLTAFLPESYNEKYLTGWGHNSFYYFFSSFKAQTKLYPASLCSYPLVSLSGEIRYGVLFPSNSLKTVRSLTLYC